MGLYQQLITLFSISQQAFGKIVSWRVCLAYWVQLGLNLQQPELPNNGRKASMRAIIVAIRSLYIFAANFITNVGYGFMQKGKIIFGYYLTFG